MSGPLAFQTRWDISILLTAAVQKALSRKDFVCQHENGEGWTFIPRSNVKSALKSVCRKFNKKHLIAKVHSRAQLSTFVRMNDPAYPLKVIRLGAVRPGQRRTSCQLAVNVMMCLLGHGLQPQAGL